MARFPLVTRFLRGSSPLLLGLILAGCAAVNSTRQNTQAAIGPKNGVAYFLPKGHVLVTLTWNPTVRSWDVAPTVIYEADPTGRFNLDWTNSILSDGDTTVGVDPGTGLLQSLNVGSSGQSLNNAGSMIGNAPNIIRLGIAIAPVSSYDGAAFTSADYDALSARRPTGVAPDGQSYSTTAQVVVNDDDQSEAVALVASPDFPGPGTNGRPPKVYAAIKVRLTKKYDLGSEFPPNQKQTVATDGKKSGGIVVRLPLPYELSVQEVISSDPTFKDSSKPRVTCSIAPRILMLPDSKHDFLYRVLSRPLVSDATKLSLSNGMIQSLEQVRPSVLAAILQFPKYLVTNVVPDPISITQTQQTVSNAQSKIGADQAAGSTATDEK